MHLSTHFCIFLAIIIYFIICSVFILCIFCIIYYFLTFSFCSVFSFPSPYRSPFFPHTNKQTGRHPHSPANTIASAMWYMRLWSASRSNSLTLRQRAWWQKLSLYHMTQYSWVFVGSVWKIPCLFISMGKDENGWYVEDSIKS